MCVWMCGVYVNVPVTTVPEVAVFRLVLYHWWLNWYMYWRLSGFIELAARDGVPTHSNWRVSAGPYPEVDAGVCVCVCERGGGLQQG